MYGDLHRKRIALDFGSLAVAAAGVIVGAATMNVIVLAAISGAGLLFNGSVKTLSLQNKEVTFQNACKIYSELLVRLKSHLRGIRFERAVLVSDMDLLKEMVLLKTPPVKQ